MKIVSVKHVQEVAGKILSETERLGNLSSRDVLVLRMGFDRLVMKLYDLTRGVTDDEFINGLAVNVMQPNTGLQSDLCQMGGVHDFQPPEGKTSLNDYCWKCGTSR